MKFVEKYGADAVRMYIAFRGPYGESGTILEFLTVLQQYISLLDRVVRLATGAQDTSEMLTLFNKHSHDERKTHRGWRPINSITQRRGSYDLNERNLNQKYQFLKKAIAELSVLLAPFCPSSSRTSLGKVRREKSGTSQPMASCFHRDCERK